MQGQRHSVFPSSGAARHLPPQGKAFINLPEALIPAQQAQEGLIEEIVAPDDAGCASVAVVDGVGQHARAVGVMQK